MNKTVILIAAGILGVGVVGTAASDSDERERYSSSREAVERGHDDVFGWRRLREDVAPVDNALYESECGGCHFAYQPGLLPADAWEQILTKLENHYGDDATLDEAELAEIRRYTVRHSAMEDSRSRSRSFAASGHRGEGLPRITQTGYFLRKHDEVPLRMVRDNPEVGSFSNCQHCHGGARRGNFDEHQVRIPGFGRWED